jgi:hypothetical protein
MNHHVPAGARGPRRAFDVPPERGGESAPVPGAMKGRWPLHGFVQQTLRTGAGESDALRNSSKSE